MVRLQLKKQLKLSRIEVEDSVGLEQAQGSWDWGWDSYEEGQAHQGKITMTLFWSENTEKIPYACYLYAHSITTGHFGVIINFFTSR